MVCELLPNRSMPQDMLQLQKFQFSLLFTGNYMHLCSRIEGGTTCDRWLHCRGKMWWVAQVVREINEFEVQTYVPP